MGIYTERFIEDLDSDPLVALCKICRHFTSLDYPTGPEEYLECYALCEEIIHIHNIDINTLNFESDNDPVIEQIQVFIDYILDRYGKYSSDKENRIIVNKFRAHFSSTISESFKYEFTSGDLDQIQKSLNDLRDLVSTSDLFEEKHKRRLLKRLEQLQFELHKKVSDLDHFWGLIGDAGVAVGKFGKDAKPFVDLIKEVTKIVWNTQSRAEELPSDTEPPALITDESLG